ncbi:MarR family transcriptional regulator [Actinomycetospora sp. NBRC 106378]|uniref:MarR family winged helix-turn-helix transcriptional regulator n=1 Tax=Actinomycetospora sp. NBRC 106378 TaxID=3032208 RepID=UPI0024A3E3C1|nr:MarR family transcriptional regulator [Actinomycetospora sp. NBRC 106378]GLZ53242.1 MarR family transcriptional regulator [Actinomycetospora sp. NBRC 106378]
MSQVGDLGMSVGYVLKQAAAALRGAMDDALRPLDLTVSQYSCLEVLGQRSGLSNSELARATFVTRQAMNQVLRGLQERGLLTRPAEASHGRSRPTELTDEGRRALAAASRAVAAVEQRMLAGFDDDGRRRLLGDLLTCRDAVS